MDTPFTQMRDKINTLLNANTALPWGSLITSTETTVDGLVVYSDNEGQTDKRHFVITVTEVPGW